MAKWIKSSEYVSFAVKERVATVRLNNPDRRNALSFDLLLEYRNALLEADDLRSVSVIVVEGAGKDFCAGYDMKASYARYADEADGGESPYRTGIGSFDDDAWKLERYAEMLRTPFDIHKPVIAKIHGNCVAGGTDLALYCDLLVAADDARIGFPATRAMGSPPNHMWVYNVGPQWAKRFLLTGDVVPGSQR
ncbi:MAG: enoyl-CoA hydratase, partial [Comamonadaceae bacterium]